MTATEAVIYVTGAVVIGTALTALVAGRRYTHLLPVLVGVPLIVVAVVEQPSLWKHPATLYLLLLGLYVAVDASVAPRFDRKTNRDKLPFLINALYAFIFISAPTE